MNTLENLYYGNIDPHEHTVSNGTDKGELCDILKLIIKLRFRGCSNFILADLGVALFSTKIAA